MEAERDQGADPEDPDEYRAVNTFWVPKEARWAFLLASAKRQTAAVYLRQLEKLGILQGERHGRETIYKHPALLDLLSE